MSRFLAKEAAFLEPYTPGEQPQNMVYNKLNTNENPFPPSPAVLEAVSAAEVSKLQLYSDPTCAALCTSVAARNGLTERQVIAGNGSDELLSFAFRAFCGSEVDCAFADITYGFYKVWAAFYRLKAEIIPLREDFSLHVEDYMAFPGTIFIANPNAPTGMVISCADVERLLRANPNRVVVIDEAYVDFGAQSCVPLIRQYDNLLVVQTFSKSRSLAGGRIGFAMGAEALIDDLNRIKYSFNPYNVNRLSILAGKAAMEDEAYFTACTAQVQQNRAWVVEKLNNLGFIVLPSMANFVFARSNKIGGGELYEKLKENGVLVRHFNTPDRIRDYCRISIGSAQQLSGLIDAISKILEGRR